jgi:hypothetical protein
MKRGTIVRDQHYRLLAKSGELHFRHAYSLLMKPSEASMRVFGVE